jgi:hypothetical protein
MKIVVAWPPNIKQIEQVFGKLSDNTVFTYGDTIYNPGDGVISEPLRIHELTHVAQQGPDPKGWWAKYLNSPKFRLDEEVEAYSNEFNCYRTFMKDRNKQAVFLHGIAKKLSSPLYGSLVTHSEALNLIKDHADRGYSKR